MPRALSILLADHEDITLKTIGTYLSALGHRVDEAHDGPAALSALRTNGYDVALISPLLPTIDGLSVLASARETGPETPAVLMVKQSTSELGIQALRLGVLDILTKPVKLSELDAVLEKVARGMASFQPQGGVPGTVRPASAGIPEAGPPYLVGISPAMRRVREQIEEVVAGGCRTVLVTGETGTGKEVVAREIHARTGPEDRPFVAVSCPALPDTLVEAELFGHVKGAFTGATADRAGCFELANAGTLFLDEIADFPAVAQATLLRVLETRTFRRVGGVRDIAVDVRVIAATNAPLDEMVRSGQFRSDLYYRLNAYHIHLLPLRERPEDILPLAEYFLSVFARARGLSFKGFSPEAQRLLASHAYPGNGRELRSLIERATLRCRDGLVLPDHLDMPAELPDPPPSPSVLDDEDSERATFLRVLEAARWNRREAARALGIPYHTFRYWLKKQGIR
jgi:DNA-binding NtrC family response regulator